MRPTPLPDDDRIKEIARDYALECRRGNVRPTLMGAATRLGRNSLWLVSRSTHAAVRVRAIVMAEWMALGIEIDPNSVDVQCYRKSRAKATAPAPAPTPEPEPEPEQNPMLPTEYLGGADLYQVLQHPGRLEQFCRLVDSLGPAGAFRYAQMVRDFNPGNSRIAKPHDEVA